MEKYFNEISDRAKIVHENIEKAALKVGRSPKEITLLGVTKTQNAQAVRAVIEAGVHCIGENKVQEILEKEPFLVDLPHETHMIGHLQKNKVKFLPNKITLLQSLDSFELLDVIENIFDKNNLKLDVLIEVNIGLETSKTGVFVKDLDAFVERVCQSSVVNLRGLMAIPPICDGEEIRRYFEQIYRLFVDIKDKKIDNKEVNILSMGMSSDYEYAVMEGATMVRVGSYLFGPRV